MTFEQLFAKLKPLVQKEIKKLYKWAAPMIADANRMDETSRKMVAKAIYKMACFTTATAMGLTSCPAEEKLLYRTFLVHTLHINGF